MGFIHKIKKNSITILPVTVADAVIMNDKDNGNLTEHLKKLGDDVDTLKSWFDVDEAGNIHTKDNRGFYSESFVSAGGKSTTEGGGGTGGANLSQVWESLQGNNDTFKDRLINVAHIPTLTTGKISDFVSATQAIANTAVANKADKATTLAGYGITDAVTLNTDQTISGEKTFSKFKVSNKNLVTNLNANMVGGYISSVLFTCESGYGVDVNAPHRNKKSGPLLYRISSNCTNIPPLCTNGVLVHFNSQGTDTAFQLVSDYSNTVLYYRSGNLNESGTEYLYNRTWKQFAFTDKVLPLTGGTLTGALTVNAPINNTGALKLLGASEVSSTGMAVHAGAKALGSHANALGYYTTTERHYQTVIGCYNEPDTSSLFVIGAGSNEQNRKNVFTVDTYGHVRMGGRLYIGVGGQNEVYLHSDAGDQLYVHTSAGIPFLIQRDFVRRGSSTPNTTLGTDQYKWFNVFTESLKIADANLTYDIGTLTIDKALKTTSTLTATQGVFSNYIKIGNATISWNPKGYLEINEGLASQKFISAGGVVTGDAGGGAGGIEESSTIAELRQRVAQLEAQLISLTNKE